MAYKPQIALSADAVAALEKRYGKDWRAQTPAGARVLTPELEPAKRVHAMTDDQRIEEYQRLRAKRSLEQGEADAVLIMELYKSPQEYREAAALRADNERMYKATAANRLEDEARPVAALRADNERMYKATAANRLEDEARREAVLRADNERMYRAAAANRLEDEARLTRDSQQLGRALDQMFAAAYPVSVPGASPRAAVVAPSAANSRRSLTRTPGNTDFFGQAPRGTPVMIPPAGAAPSKAEPAPRDKNATGRSYTVRPGDDLYSIAIRYGVSPTKIRALNKSKFAGTVEVTPGSVVELPPEVD